MQKHSIFEFLPFETMISEKEQDYYTALAKSDKEDNSTASIKHIRAVIDSSWNKFLGFNNQILSSEDRLDYFMALDKDHSLRKEYMDVFKNISAATASRDLKKGVALNLFFKLGEKSKARYKIDNEWILHLECL